MRPAMRLSFVIGLAGACAALLYVTFALAPTVRAQTVATATATRVVTPTATLALAATATSTPVSSTATATPLPTSTNTATPLPATNTPAVTSTATAIPPITATSTPLPTATATATQAPTTAPTATSTATPVVTPTVVFTPTATPTVMLTATLVPTSSWHLTAVNDVSVTVLSTDDSVPATLASADGKLHLLLPPGAIGQAAEIRHQVTAKPANSGLLYTFKLEARARRDASAIARFSEPLTLTLHPERFSPDLTTDYYKLSFFTLNEATGNWEAVPTTRDSVAHTISTRISHFSQWGIGFGSSSNPDGLPSVQGFNQIDRLSGAATVDYPLNLPAAPLQPGLALHYNSNAVNDKRWDNGNGTDSSDNFLDVGWDLSGFSMIFGRLDLPGVRTISLVSPAGSGRIMSLVGDNYWHTNDESYAVIQPLPGAWRIWDKSGTQYLLSGFTTNIDWATDAPHTCDTAQPFFNGWYVTAITDTHNNTMTVAYETDTYTTTINCDGYYVGPGGNDRWGFHDETRTYISAVHPSRVTYGNGNAYIQFIYVNKSETLTCSGACETKRLTEIRVYAYGQRARTYTLEYTSNPVRLWRIAQKERGETPSAALPPYVFTYGTTGNDADLLTLAQNGYGGEVEFHYGLYNYPPVCGDYGGIDPCGNDGRPWNRYAVISKTVRARQNDGSSWNEFGTAYAYSGMRVHNTTGDLSYVEERSRKFLGFHTVTETLYAGAVGSAVLGSNATDFYQYARNDGTPCYDPNQGYIQCAWNKINPLHGRVMETRQYNAAGALLTKSKNTYAAVWLKRGDGMQEIYKRYFSRLDQVDHYQCEGAATCVQTRANYVYDVYGNVISEYQRGNLAADSDPVNNKSTHRGYIATQNATTYVVNRPNFENTYQGISGNVGAGCGCWLTSQYFYYNGSSVWDNQTITTGDLTRVDKWDIAASSVVIGRTAYDAWGNPTVVTDTRGYATTTVYDGVYHVLPLAVTNALGQQSVTQYDLTLQKPLTVTDPNGAATSLAYDTFGRRVKLVRPGDSHSAATQDYAYYDSEIPLRILLTQREISGAGGVMLEERFYNGLGQLVQLKNESVDGMQMTVQHYTYNALGQKEREYVPVADTYGTWAPPAFWAYSPLTNTALANTYYQYDALARPVRAVFPDGTTSSTAYGQLAQTTVDANRHLKLSFQDALGRLSAVDETLVRWSDGFDNAGLPGWSLWNNQVTASGSTLNEVGNGVDYNSNAVRVATTHDSQGVVFDFELDTGGTPDSELFLETGDWPAGSWRSWGLRISGGVIARQAYGVADASLLTLKTGVWYRALLKAGGTGEFITQVWERDNPASGAELREVKSGDGNWVGRTWNFMARVKVGTQRLDNYDELQFNTTRYGYDALGHLTRVTDTVGNTTVITYDNLGRKTGMIDPDMGRWLYSYDAAGNLTSQTDAKGQTIGFAYDALNRVNIKQYPVNSGQSPITYTYDTGTNGIGNRTRMDDATGYTTWAYDARARVTREVKSITGVGVFTTSTTYDAADRVRTLTYPSGEVVTQTYDARGLSSTLVGATAYVSQTTYNILGQVTAQAFGNGLTTNYAYSAANYRLQQIQVGALMDLRYSYDPVGNVKVLTDTTNSNQVASFGYDALDRLTSAATNAAGNGQYSETYAYDPLGNLTIKAGSVYTYGDSAHKHAATAAGSNTYAYDLNGNMTRRAEAGITYYQGWNADNRLDTVQYEGFAQYFNYDGAGRRTRTVTYLNGAATLTDTFDTANSALWVYTTTYQTVPYNDGGQNVVRNVGTGVNYDANFYRTASSLSNGDSASVDFKVDVSDSVAHFALETSDGGTNSRWAVIAYGGKLYVQYLVNAGAYNWVYPKDLVNPVQLNTWYRLTLRVDDVDGFRIEVRERDGGAGSASYQFAMPAGKTWRFHHWTYRGTVMLDNYVERTDSKAVLAYPSALYERNVTAGTGTSYYFAGGKRVAVRNNAGLYFIQGDHLGSNSLTTSITGTEVARTSYYPYGGTRTTSGAQQTDRQFTDQRAEGAALGALYDYGARHYDTYLDRFISADSIVPGAGNPQALNRYSYVLGNPLKYRDPSGHCPNNFCDFLAGFLAQIAHDANPIPSGYIGSADALAVQPSESDAMLVGRLAGSVGSTAISVAEVLVGSAGVGGGTAGGLLTCAETLGAGCIVGAGIAIGSAALVADGVGHAARTGAAAADTVNVLMARGNKTQGHHPWPMYLGGPKKQPLLELKTDLHEKFHAGLDKVFARNDGTKKWRELSSDQQRDILESVLTYSQDFDAEYGTHTLDAVLDVLKEQGITPP